MRQNAGNEIAAALDGGLLDDEHAEPLASHESHGVLVGREEICGGFGKRVDVEFVTVSCAECVRAGRAVHWLCASCTLLLKDRIIQLGNI